jgi:undecaprenyl-diphosphatase
MFVRAQGDWNVGLPWERALMLSIDRTVPTWVDWIMLSLPWLGTNLTLAPIIAVVSLWLWLKKGRRDLAVHLVVAVLGGLAMNAILKDVFNRPRPDLWPHRGQFAWTSYPSGHAIVGVAIYFTIARMLLRERGWRWPFVVAFVQLGITLYSRIYLGVHWPTDVIGGILLGLAWLISLEIAFSPMGTQRGSAAFHRANRLQASRSEPIRATSK